MRVPFCSRPEIRISRGKPDGFHGRNLRCPSGRNPGGNQYGHKGRQRRSQKGRPGRVNPHGNLSLINISKGSGGKGKGHANSRNAGQDAERNSDARCRISASRYTMLRSLPGRRADGRQQTKLLRPVADRDGEGIIHQGYASRHNQKNQDHGHAVKQTHKRAISQRFPVSEEVARCYR